MSCEIQKTDYFEHLVNTESCIYHKLVLEFEALESFLDRASGDRTVLFFRHVQVPAERNKNTFTSRVSDG